MQSVLKHHSAKAVEWIEGGDPNPFGIITPLPKNDALLKNRAELVLSSDRQAAEEKGEVAHSPLPLFLCPSPMVRKGEPSSESPEKHPYTTCQQSRL